MNTRTTTNGTSNIEELASSLGVTEVSAAIREGDLTSETYVNALLSRANEHAHLNAFITIDEEAALDAARQADRARASGSIAPLLGVPFGVKDSYLTAGLRTTLGVGTLRNHVPRQDADLVKAVKGAGGIVFGKNNLVEMSWGLTGENGAYGQTRNAHDPDRVSGGSSSGSAVAVAAGIVPAAFGGDTVGSVRVPASLNGVVGFKPTTGRWPRAGVAPISHTLDTGGLIARSVADCRVVDRIVTGAPAEVETAVAHLDGITLAYAPEHHLGVIDPTIARAFHEALERFRDAGAQVIEVDLGPDFLDLAKSLTWNIFFRETRQAIVDFVRENNIPAAFEDIYSDLRPQLKEAWSYLVLPSGAGFLSEEVFAQSLWTDRPALQHRFDATFEGHQVDAFVLPTTRALAPRIEAQGRFHVAGTEVDDLFLATNTIPASGAGLPALTMPLGATADGLTYGLELDGRHGNDLHLLTVASRVERVLKG